MLSKLLAATNNGLDSLASCNRVEAIAPLLEGDDHGDDLLGYNLALGEQLERSYPRARLLAARTHVANLLVQDVVGADRHLGILENAHLDNAALAAGYLESLVGGNNGARALEGNVDTLAVGKFRDDLAEIFACLVDATVGTSRKCELKTFFVLWQASDDDVAATCLAGLKHHLANSARTKDADLLALLDIGLLDGGVNTAGKRLG